MKEYKYSGAYRISSVLGELIDKSEAIKQIFLLPSSETILIPVPLHKRRVLDRGYNQSSLICNEISRITELPVHENLISRVKKTEQMARITREDRHKHLKSAFEVNRLEFEVLDNQIQNLIIVDDVTTSGTTLLAVGKAIHKVYPNFNLYGFTIFKA